MSSTAFDTLGSDRAFGSEDFPGCESFRLPASEIEADFRRRIRQD